MNTATKTLPLSNNIDTDAELLDRRCLIIDFETTGKNPATAEVLQCSIIDGFGRPQLSEYFKPERDTEWPSAAWIHGITPEKVADKPHFRERIPFIENLIASAPFLIAYNARYELGILRQYGVTVDKPFIDPMLMFAEVYGEWNEYHGNYRWQKLTTAARYYGYEFTAHDALADVRATLHIYECMVAEDVPPEVI